MPKQYAGKVAAEKDTYRRKGLTVNYTRDVLSVTFTILERIVPPDSVRCEEPASQFGILRWAESAP